MRDPIVVLPTFPRVLSFGERAEIPVTVRNDTGTGGEIEVTLRIEGEARVDGEATRAVRVEHGSETTVYFGLRTGEGLGDTRLERCGVVTGES